VECKKRTGNVDHAIAALADGQHGVVSRRQLRDLGLTDRAISARALRGNLHPLFRGTFAVGHRAVGRTGRMFAAVLACGPGAVVSHGSAAELLGLWDRQPTVVDVIAPRRAGRRIQGVRWHNVLRLAPDEVEVRKGIPGTTPSRTLADMAGQTGERTIRRLVEQTAVLGLLDAGEVDRILTHGRRRGAPCLRRALAPWRTGDERQPRLRSILEGRLLPALIDAGLPRPQCNFVLRLGEHRLELDLFWQEQRLVIEADGRETHATPAAFERDRWRDQLLVAAGYRTARVTWAQLENEPEAIVARIRRMLETQ
jgi:hypothetical protein